MLDKYAELLTHYCLKIQPKDKVYVRSSYLAEPLLQALQKTLLEAGAIVDYAISFDKQDRLYYDHASESNLDSEPKLYDYAIANMDCILTIDSPFDARSLDGVPSEKKLRRAKTLAPIRNRFMERAGKKDLRWTLCEYPTETAAKESGMSLSDYENFIFTACKLNTEDPIAAWKALSSTQKGIVDYLNNTETIQFIGPNGTDISFSTKGRRWINSDGICNMPSGEVFTSPVEDSGNGRVYFSYPTLHNGQDVEGVSLEVENGYVKKWQAKIGQSALDEAFEIPGSRYFGEIAIGTNYEIQVPTKNILFDEKIGGSIHMAIGASYPETGGKNESSLHWDLITDMREGGKIIVDNTLIYENGHFIL